MCECVEYDDGSLYLCPVDADIHLETEKQRKQAIALLREIESVIDWPPEGGGGIDHDDVDAKHSCPVFFASPNCRACAALSHLREYLGGKRLEGGDEG